MSNPIITLILSTFDWTTPDGTPVTVATDDSDIEITPDGAKPRSRKIPKIVLNIDGIVNISPKLSLGGPVIVQDYLVYPKENKVTGRLALSDIPVVLTSPSPSTLLLTFPNREASLTLKTKMSSISDTIQANPDWIAPDHGDIPVKLTFATAAKELLVRVNGAITITGDNDEVKLDARSVVKDYSEKDNKIKGRMGSDMSPAEISMPKADTLILTFPDQGATLKLTIKH